MQMVTITDWLGLGTEAANSWLVNISAAAFLSDPDKPMGPDVFGVSDIVET